MGLNILIMQKKGDRFSYADVDFDTSKYTGDRDFAARVTEDAIAGVIDEYTSDSCFRPNDFADLRDWVTRKISPEGNRNRLLHLIDLLQADESLWLYFSS